MTVAERAEIEAAAPSAALLWADVPETGLVRLLALGGSCPLLVRHADGTASCSVHAVRPYNCRRFICGRPSLDEPFEQGPDGCQNLNDRLAQSLDFHEFYRANQRRAQRAWADAHGWKDRA